jgi:hypothetical protein
MSETKLAHPVMCQQCGAAIPDTSHFCAYCGFVIHVADAEQLSCEKTSRPLTGAYVSIVLCILGGLVVGFSGGLACPLAFFWDSTALTPGILLILGPLMGMMCGWKIGYYIAFGRR